MKVDLLATVPDNYENVSMEGSAPPRRIDLREDLSNPSNMSPFEIL
jgi:hypothetical protein